jgi:2-polyprenyl-3-methyl-5-hydroxy-6-metoxy-1,4-benzoquinol methylase
MGIVGRSKRFVTGFVLSYGPEAVKRRIWNKEYSENKWAFADSTVGDCVYEHLERFAKNGTILDLGCGSGNTSTEMANSAYQKYIGVDISEAALEKARARSRQCGRQEKNSFACSDFFSFQTDETFDVVLFRESMYHVPLGKVKAILDRYSVFLKKDGVFIIRLFAGNRETSKSKYRPMAMLRIIEKECEVVEKRQYPLPGMPTVIVCRPKKAHGQD